MSEFNRGLSPEFIGQLKEEGTKGSWWADALNDPKLFVAVREEYLNVYWRGQSLFLVKPGLRVTTHVKFLVDPKLADQVSLVEGKFDVGGLVQRGFARDYNGPATLAKMKTAAGLFAGPEKTGCHEIILANPAVIDREIAFPGIIPPDDGGPDETAGQVDLLSLEPDGDAVRLVFWEAKHFTNGDLRARGANVPVCKQIARYRQYLSEHCDDIEKSYRRVVRNLVDIDNMRRKPRLPPLIREVADGTRELALGAEPKVGIVIFGFNKAEKDDANWKHHLERLKSEVKLVVAVGDAKNIRLKLWACD